MGSDQHFCLRWNNFHSNIAASFEHLRDHEDFVDVTLACEGKSLKAHKIVLSACSPYFKILLQQNPCQHPIIILRDVAFPDLSALLSFVYQGEVYVSQERLPTFLRTAEMLHIKGLTEQNHPSSTAPVTIGPPSCTTVLQATHDQGIINNSVSDCKVTPSSPRCNTPPSPRKFPNSPPPKKVRRSATITPLPYKTSSSSPRRTTTAKVFATTTSDIFATSQDVFATTTPDVFATTPSELIVTPTSFATVPKKVIKQEREDVIKEEEGDEDDEAVNLIMDGSSSILRQRIQGLRGSPDRIAGFRGSPDMPNNGRGALSSHEESSMDEGFIGGADGVHDEGDNKGSPMVIRSPLVGILPMEAPGLFGGAGTSGSLSHHDSSQDAEYLVRACVPKFWNSRQPGICPICNRVFSNKFNLKQHIINIHTKGEGVDCDLCHKKCKNKWYLRRHQVTHHGAPLKRNRTFPVEHYVNDENTDRATKDKD